MHGKLESAKNILNELISAIQTREPANWHINYEFATLLSHLCGYNTEFIRQSVELAENAIASAPDNFAVNVELAYHNYLMKNYRKALDIYKKAARINDTATDALIGLIKCRLVIEGEFKEEVCLFTYLLMYHLAIS